MAKEGSYSDLAQFLRKYYHVIAIVFALTAMLFYILVAAVPDWYITRPQHQSFGLFRTCDGVSCSRTNFTAFVSRCSRNGSDLKNRFQDAAAFMSAAILFAAGVIVTIIWFTVKAVDEFEGVYYFMTTASTFLGMAASVIGVGIAGVTITEWMHCGLSYCDAMAPAGFECNWGVSAGCGIAAVGLFGIATLVMLAPAVTCNRFRKGVAMWTTVFILLFVIALLVCAASTSMWVEQQQTTNKLGLFRSCSGNSCRGYDFPSRITMNAQCTRDGSQLNHRLDTAGAFFIMAAILMFFAACILFIHPTGMLLKVVIGIVGFDYAFYFIALGTALYTFNRFLYCGHAYCDSVAMPGLGCELGFAQTAYCLAGLFHTFLLALCLFVMVFPEDPVDDVNEPMGEVKKDVEAPTDAKPAETASQPPADSEKK